MRKGSAISLVIVVSFMSVIVGIAALPDEVLEESTHLAKSDTVDAAVTEKLIVTVPKAPEINVPQPVVSEPEPPKVSEPEIPEVSEPEPPQVSEPEIPEVTEKSEPEPDTSKDESKGKVIRVEVRDGVGTSLR